MVPWNPLFADRWGATCIHWRSPVTSANASIRDWPMVTQSLGPRVVPIAWRSSSTVRSSSAIVLKVGYSDTGRARPRAGADESGSGEIQLIRTLVVAGRRQAEDLAPWLAYMGRTGTIEAEVTDDVSSLTRLAGFDVIMAHPPEGELLPAAERALCEFVQR